MIVCGRSRRRRTPVAKEAPHSKRKKWGGDEKKFEKKMVNDGPIIVVDDGRSRFVERWSDHCRW